MCPGRALWASTLRLGLDCTRVVIPLGLREASAGGGAHSTKAKLSLMGSQQVALSLSQLLEKNNIYSTPQVFVVSSQHKYFEYLPCARCCVGTGEWGLKKKKLKEARD